jgi:hypothetical protein
MTSRFDYRIPWTASEPGILQDEPGIAANGLRHRNAHERRPRGSERAANHASGQRRKSTLGTTILCGFNGEHIVGHHGPPDALDRELAHSLNLHNILYRHQHPRTNQDLARRSLITEARGNIRDGPDSGVVESSLETDSPHRSEPMLDTDSKADIARACAASRLTLRLRRAFRVP